MLYLLVLFLLIPLETGSFMAQENQMVPLGFCLLLLILLQKSFIHCATASRCYGNKDDVHKNSVRDVASGAQGFLQSLGSCFQSLLISKDKGNKLRGRSIYSRNLCAFNSDFSEVYFGSSLNSV